MAIRIEFTMVNGEKYTVSTRGNKNSERYNEKEERYDHGPFPFSDVREAAEELDRLTADSRAFVCDQGVSIFTGRIVTARILADDPSPEPRMTPVKGSCSCCGREFEERLRYRDRAGETWSGVLERYRRDGVCPLCYNTFGFVHGSVKMWADDIWNGFINDKLKNIDDPQALKEIEAAALKRDPDLATKVRHKVAEVQAARKAAERKNDH